jgi:hypothetical protein
MRVWANIATPEGWREYVFDDLPEPTADDLATVESAKAYRLRQARTIWARTGHADATMVIRRDGPRHLLY